MLFAVKQVIGALLLPLPFAAFLIASGLLARFARRPRLCLVLVSVGSLVAVLATIGAVGNGLLWPLETRYASIINAVDLPDAPRYIVVLGSGYQPRDGLPVTAALDATAVVRLTEAVRLYRLLPGSALVVSGGGVNSSTPAAHGYAKAAEALGVPRESIILSDNALDTGEEIRALRDRLGNASILLVTSASHMPRAMAHCMHNGVRAIPAPTGQLAEPPSAWGMRMWLFPSGVNLRKTEIALHEYVGLLALRADIW